MSDNSDEFVNVLMGMMNNKDEQEPSEEKVTYPEDLFDDFIEALKDNNLVRECSRRSGDVLEIGTHLYVVDAYALPSLFILYNDEDESFKLHDYSNTWELAEMCNITKETVFEAVEEVGLQHDEYRIYTYVDPENVSQAVTAYGIALYNARMICVDRDDD